MFFLCFDHRLPSFKVRVTTRKQWSNWQTCPNQDVINYKKLTNFCHFGQFSNNFYVVYHLLIHTCFCQFNHCFLVVGVSFFRRMDCVSMGTQHVRWQFSYDISTHANWPNPHPCSFHRAASDVPNGEEEIISHMNTPLCPSHIKIEPLYIMVALQGNNVRINTW